MEQFINLRHLLQHEVNDLYSAEEQIIEAMPAMIEKASAQQLKNTLNEHLKVTRDQLKRLDRVRQILSKENKGEEENKSFFEKMFGKSTKCKGMEGLIKEGEKMMKEDMEPSVKDAAIIASSQKIEHYEISGYGTARAYANQLGMVEVERQLQTTLNEEYKADDLLTVLALRKVNVDAHNGDVKRAPEPKKAAKKTASSKPAAAKKSTAAKKAKKKSAAKKRTAR